MSMGSTIMQEAAPRDHLARVMSIFSLGNMGGLPLGAVSMGYCATQIGPLLSLAVAVTGIWLVAGFVWTRSDLASLEPPMIPIDSK